MDQIRKRLFEQATTEAEDTSMRQIARELLVVAEQLLERWEEDGHQVSQDGDPYYAAEVDRMVAKYRAYLDLAKAEVG